MKTQAAESLPCPSCRAAMTSLCLAALPIDHLSLDYCASCRAIWFDAHESSQLAPASVIELLTIIRDAQAVANEPIAARLACPRCNVPLILTKDLVKSGPFVYHRCPNGCGRFTPFSQFMTEKGFVRFLAPTEVAQLAARVVELHCHSCGGPIDLRSDSACPHCRSPIAVLDAEAMAKALAGYSAAAAPRIRAAVGDLQASIDLLPTLAPQRKTSLLDLGIGELAKLFV